MYNPNVAEHSRFYRHPLLLAAALFSIGVSAAGSLLSGGSPILLVVAAALFVSFGLVVAFFRSGDNPGHAHLYLASLITLAMGLLILLPQIGYAAILLSVLCVYAALLLPPRPAAAWVGVLIVIYSFGLIKLRGEIDWVALIGQASSFFAFAVVGGALRQAENARNKSQALLAELNEAHQKLKLYAVQSQALAVAEERNRLARDLHDSVKQQAFALSAQLGAARSLLARDPQAAEANLAQAAQLSDTLRQELANLIHELRPPALAEKGLAVALRDYASNWSRQTNIPVEVVASGHLDQPAVEQALFRITQEALANIARHSQAAHIVIELGQTTHQVTLTISDNGRGFDPKTSPTGLGLQSMRERAESLGGTLAIASQPGQGTSLSVQLPTHQRND